VQAGVLAGLLGIGGGMVIGPLFMSIGMQPQVGTSSCAFMILWTAASGVLNYYFNESIGAELMMYFVGIGLISGQLGQHFVSALLKKTGRPSYVVLLLGSIIGLAVVSMTIRSTISITQDAINDGAESLVTFNTDYFKCQFDASNATVVNATLGATLR